MKETIQEIQKALKEKEKLSPDALTHIKGGGCDDKRKDVGGNNIGGNMGNSNKPGGG
jgi:hypothetical protein